MSVRELTQSPSPCGRGNTERSKIRLPLSPFIKRIHSESWKLFAIIKTQSPEPMKPDELKRSIQLMRDLPSFICLIVICAVSLFFVPWWTSLALFAIGYCVLGYLTYRHAIKTVRTMTGLAHPRAQVLYPSTSNASARS